MSGSGPEGGFDPYNDTGPIPVYRPMTQEEKDALIREIRRALWGPMDAGRREHEPGLVAVVYELKSDSDKKKAVTSFLTTAVSIIGFGNIMLIIWLTLKVLGGGATP